MSDNCCFFFFQAEDGIRVSSVTGVQTCALPISLGAPAVGLSAAAVREGERAGQSVRGYLETTKQGVLALAQASGGITLGVVPTHLGVIIPVHLGVNIHLD